MHQVVAAALLRGPGEVLLCHRSPDRRWYPNVWDFPGGHIEQDELPLDGLRRELFEELGIVLDTSVLTDQPDLRVDAETVSLSLWAARVWRGDPTNDAPQEHDRIQWFELEQAAVQDLAHPAYRSWLGSLRGSG